MMITSGNMDAFGDRVYSGGGDIGGSKILVNFVNNQVVTTTIAPLAFNNVYYDTLSEVDANKFVVKSPGYYYIYYNAAFTETVNSVTRFSIFVFVNGAFAASQNFYKSVSATQTFLSGDIACVRYIGASSQIDFRAQMQAIVGSGTTATLNVSSGASYPHISYAELVRL